MKTNVKNGAFILKFLAVDDATIHIGRTENGEYPSKETASYVPVNTRSDGEYALIAETDENGVITRLVIDYPQHVPSVMNMLESEVTEIHSENILMQDGKLVE